MKYTKLYFPTGHLQAEGNIEYGKKSGRWIFYFEDSGLKFKEVDYVNDIEHGVWKMWHNNGKLYLEHTVTNGKVVGQWKEYYESGAIKEIGEYLETGEYVPSDFWDELGAKLMSNGTGIKIEKFGASDADIHLHYFENGNFIKEERI